MGSEDFIIPLRFLSRNFLGGVSKHYAFSRFYENINLRDIVYVWSLQNLLGVGHLIN